MNPQNLIGGISLPHFHENIWDLARKARLTPAQLAIDSLDFACINIQQLTSDPDIIELSNEFAVIYLSDVEIPRRHSGSATVCQHFLIYPPHQTTCVESILEAELQQSDRDPS